MSDHDNKNVIGARFQQHPGDSVAEKVQNVDARTGASIISDYLTMDTDEEHLRDIQVTQFEYFKRGNRALISQLPYPENGFV